MKKARKTKNKQQPEQLENTAELAEGKNKEKEKEKDKVLDSLIGTIEDVEEALEGDASDVELQPEESSLFTPEQPLMKKRKTFFVVGLFIVIMAIIGIISTVNFCVGFATDIANQTAVKNEFAAFVYPMVITDTPAFESADQAPGSVVVSASIWQILLSGKTDKYEAANGMMTIPAIDVESSAVSIFGTGLTVQHQTTGSGENVFTYNESTNTYTVPSSPRFSSYSPHVTEISSVGELYTVIVEYIPPTAATFDGIEYETAADKTMVYTISRTATSMTIRSVAYGEMKI